MKSRITLQQQFATLAAASVLFACVAGAEPSTPLTSMPGTARISDQDFARSDRFLFGQVDTAVLNGEIAFQWIGEGNSFFYRSQRADGVRYLRVDSATGRKTPLFDNAVMATALSKALATTVSADRLHIDQLTRVEEGVYRVRSGEKHLTCNLATAACEAHTPEKMPTGMPSPTGRYVLFSRDHDLWLKDNANGGERALTSDGVRGWSYGRPPESSSSEVTRRRFDQFPAVGALWAPDGRRFVSYRLDERHVAEIALVQAIPEDGSFRPKLHTYHYDLPGERGAEAAFFIYDVESGARTPIDYRALPASVRVPIALGHVWWSADGSKLYLLDAPLTQPFMKLVEVNASTGSVRLLVEEHADTTYFPNSNRLATPNVRVLGNGDVIWFSERDGWGHLYRYDGRSGKLKNAVTSGSWLVRDIVRIDERSGYVYLVGSGRERGEDIYNRHLYRVKLDGSGLQLLTPDVGDHDFPSLAPQPTLDMGSQGLGTSALSRISPNGEYIIDHFSTVQSPGRWLLRRKDGSLIARLEDEDPSPLPAYTTPDPFVVKSADGKYDLFGVLSKPPGFDPSKRYPVIDSIYPGPQIIKAPKTFAGGSLFSAGGYIGGAILGDAQALADLGFVVIQVDGRGGPLRSKAFRDLSYRRMETAGMLEDHIAALRQLARTRPWLDLDRVGIFGSSGGGFATGRALIDHPDFFKVGVASVGNHEQRAYGRTWAETFHGPTQSTDYAKVFAGNDVSRFKGKLLLAHGELDDNVHPALTLRLADALIKGNKQFDMLIMPNVNHGIVGVPYFRRITQIYFLRHLMRAELPSDSAIALPEGVAQSLR